ncbi:hypothetical protein GW17_00056191 [Ensete ventricosum]|nr:hypothetical protein GW17_00056191 [Ensete ventricosum]
MRFMFSALGDSPRCRKAEQTPDCAVSAATRSGSGTMATRSPHASSVDSLFVSPVTSTRDERETRPVHSATPVTSATKVSHLSSCPRVEGDDDDGVEMDDFEEEFQTKSPKKTPDDRQRFDANSVTSQNDYSVLCSFQFTSMTIQAMLCCRRMENGCNRGGQLGIPCHPLQAVVSGAAIPIHSVLFVRIYVNFVCFLYL